MYIIPEQVLKEFQKVSSSNKSVHDGGLIETLAYLIGYWCNWDLIATDLVFPNQSATSSHVDDRGKQITLSIFYDQVFISNHEKDNLN